VRDPILTADTQPFVPHCCGVNHLSNARFTRCRSITSSAAPTMRVTGRATLRVFGLVLRCGQRSTLRPTSHSPLWTTEVPQVARSFEVATCD